MSDPTGKVVEMNRGERVILTFRVFVLVAFFVWLAFFVSEVHIG